MDFQHAVEGFASHLVMEADGLRNGNEIVDFHPLPDPLCKEFGGHFGLGRGQAAQYKEKDESYLQSFHIYGFPLQGS